MNKIFNSLLIIAGIIVMTFSATDSFFSSTTMVESIKDTSADPIEIAVNSQNPWSETFDCVNMEPGEEKEINLTITNIGKSPAKIWKIIENVLNEENGINEPEQEWYNVNGEKNDLDSVMLYKIEVDSVVIVSGTTVSDIKNSYLYLGELGQYETMSVNQTYHFKNNTENWAQSDRMIFDIGIIARDLNAPDPSVEIENRVVVFEPIDIDSQYGYNHDYSNAEVSFVYYTPSVERLSGTMQASGLKPYATYQVKFEGKPVCNNGVNDLANKYIGYKGRWTCVDCSGTAVSRNRSDAQYIANELLPDDDPDKECIVGYLVFDFFTADGNGDIEITDATILSDTSSHVLRCGGGVCGNSGDTHLAYLDSDHNPDNLPAVKFCPYNKVNEEIEAGRGGCGGLTLDAGIYDLKITLTEESFHQGNWATVLIGDINFEILDL